MSTLTPSQQSLLDRIRACCLGSPGGILSGTYERICQAIHKPKQHDDFMKLFTGGYIGVAQTGEKWHIWIIPQEIQRERILPSLACSMSTSEHEKRQAVTVS